jgi:hypothetical protein
MSKKKTGSFGGIAALGLPEKEHVRRRATAFKLSHEAFDNATRAAGAGRCGDALDNLVAGLYYSGQESAHRGSMARYFGARGASALGRRESQAVRTFRRGCKIPSR